MHHTIKVDEVIAHRDKAFAEFWASHVKGSEGINPEFVAICHDTAAHAFQKGFYVGIRHGVEHGAKAAGAVIASDLTDLLGGSNDES